MSDMSHHKQFETSRSEVMRSLQLLDCPQSASFDRITDLVIRSLDCHGSSITLLEGDQVRLLSVAGDEKRYASYKDPLAARCVTRGEPVLVSDTGKDQNVIAGLREARSPKIRSWAGAPIYSPDGTIIGALCVSDRQPGKFSRDDLETLQCFAKTVDDLIKAHVRTLLLNALNESISDNANRLESANLVFRQAERVAKIGTWNLVIESGELEWSDQVYDLHGRSGSDQITLERAIEYYPPEDRSRVEALLEKTISSGEPFVFEANIVREDGSVRRVRSMGERLNTEGFHDRLVGIIQDITDAHQAAAALQWAADRDSLTGLYNRHSFDRFLKNRIKTHKDTGGSLIMALIDLDGFKDINDTYGHLVGDVVLQEISSRLGQTMPKGSLLARWGGDEFAIIAPIGATKTEVEAILQSVLETIATPIEVSYETVKVGATCGIAQFTGNIGGKEMVRMADLALYHGKNRETGAFHHYSPMLERESRARQKAISDVQDALEHHRVFAGYQPIVDMNDDQVVGFEALMRLRGPKGETVTAGQVLPALIDPGLARAVGYRMLDLLCQDFKAISKAYPDLQFLSINSTEADLLGRDFAGTFLAKLRENAIQTRSVTLEVTETMLLVNDTETIKGVLQKLDQAGVSIALDDFGTGFSSLSHLRDFPISKVKIDQSFIQNICDKHESRMIVQALIAMGRSLGIEVIAEGIETDAQKSLLTQMGCRLGQGFLFSPAQSASRLSLIGANVRQTSQKGSVMKKARFA